MKLCNTSRWKNIRRDLITNISSHTITREETLSIGLKFCTGFDKRILSHSRWNDHSIKKGVKQGIVACCTATATAQKPSIPKRYIDALKDVRRNKDVLITSSGKGGRVVLMDNAEYVGKTNDLLTTPTQSNELTSPEGS